MEKSKHSMNKCSARILWILVLTACLAGVYAVLDYVISDDSEAMTRITFHDFYESEPIDVLFVGPSHTIYGINAAELTEQTGKSVFSLSTSGMNSIHAYYVLKEAFRTREIPKVFLEVSPSRMTVESSHMTATHCITDYVKSPVIRAETVFDTLEPEDYIGCLFRLRRNMDISPNLKSMKKVVAKKRKETYRDYVWTGSGDYFGRGHFERITDTGRDGATSVYLHSNNLDNYPAESIQRKQMAFLEKSIRLCQRKGAEICLYVCPYSDVYLNNFTEYESVMETVRELCAGYGVTLLDMNYAKEQYLDILPGDFSDLDHLNRTGCGKLTDFLGRYLKDPSPEYFSTELREGNLTTQKVMAVGYDRSYITKTGEYDDFYAAVGKVRSVRITVSAYPDGTVPVTVTLTEMKRDESSGEWIPGETVIPVRTEETETEYMLPFAGKGDSYYRVELADPVTGEILCSCRTNFNMN